MLIKHMKFFVVCNYEKLVITELVESTGVTVLVVCRPSEHFPLPFPRVWFSPAWSKGLSHDEQKQVSMVPFVTWNTNSIANAPCVNSSDVEYMQPWGTTFHIGA